MKRLAPDWLRWARGCIILVGIAQVLLFNLFAIVLFLIWLNLPTRSRAGWWVAVVVMTMLAVASAMWLGPYFAAYLGMRGLAGREPSLWYFSIFGVTAGASVGALVGLFMPGTRQRIGGVPVSLVCPACEYDLRGSPVKCPECGWVVTAEMRADLERAYPALRPTTSVEDWRSGVGAVMRPASPKVDERQVMESGPVRVEANDEKGRERWLYP